MTMMVGRNEFDDNADDYMVMMMMMTMTMTMTMAMTMMMIIIIIIVIINNKLINNNK